MTINLGVEPNPIQVTLVPGFDFAATITSTDGAWPVGCQVLLVFGDTEATEWEATVAGANATFTIDAALVDDVISRLGGTAATAALVYVEGTTRLPWGLGPVTIRRT